jgi:hypothetical protein
MPTAAQTPIKVSTETDALIGHAAHFLHTTKKEVVDRAVRDFVEAHRDELNAGVRDALNQLDGSKAGALSLLTGMSRERIDELGGI